MTMDKKKLAAVVVALVLSVAGAYFGVDFKGAVCGDSAAQGE